MICLLYLTHSCQFSNSGGFFFFIFDINFSYSSNKDKNYISTSSSGNQCPLGGSGPETADENEARLCRGR